MGRQLVGGSGGSVFSATPFLCTEEKARGGQKPVKSLDSYQEAIRFKDRFKDGYKKNGFGTSDFPKRDEFSNTMRTEQYRETLRKTSRQVKQANAQATARGAGTSELDMTARTNASPSKKTHLYDVVTRTIEPSFKHKRDDRQVRPNAWRDQCDEVVVYMMVQARFFFAEERKRDAAGEEEKPIMEWDGSTTRWVNVTCNGRPMNVLVDGSGKVCVS